MQTRLVTIGACGAKSSGDGIGGLDRCKNEVLGIWLVGEIAGQRPACCVLFVPQHEVIAWAGLMLWLEPWRRRVRMEDNARAAKGSVPCACVGSLQLLMHDDNG
jgi:hypothetical protein